MLEWERFFSPASPAQIERFEMDHGVKLPPHYRNYLASANGGRPILDTGFVIPEINEKVMLGFLFSISDQEKDHLNLRRVIAEFDDCPHGYLPIGRDPGGNQLLLAISGGQEDEIYYWDRAHFYERITRKIILKISNNIYEFVKSLHLM